MIVKIVDGKFVKVTKSQMQKEHPNVSFSLKPPADIEISQSAIDLAIEADPDFVAPTYEEKLQGWRDTLKSYGYFYVEAEPDPAFDFKTQTLSEPVFTAHEDGRVTSRRNVISRPDEELAGVIRSQRTALLQGTDWIVTKAAESGEAVPQEWAAYRQALRDVPAQEGFPKSVTWPEKP